MPHIEERRKKMGEGEGKRKKKAAKEKVSGWKEVCRKAKERQRHVARQRAARKRIASVSSMRGAKQKKKETESTKARGGGDHIFAADHDSFNVKLECVCNATATFTSPCLPAN